MNPTTSDRRYDTRLAIPSASSNPLSATLGVVPRAAMVCDVSLRGLGLITVDPPPVDSLVPVWLAMPAAALSELLLGRVVHSEPLGGTLHRIGVTCSDDADVHVLRSLYEQMRRSA